MNRTWKPVALLFACGLLVSAHADNEKKPSVSAKPATVVDPLRQMMEKKGYVAIPLIRHDEDNRFTVECKSGTDTFRLLVDTGATASSLDMDLVKKLGLKHRGETTSVGLGGRQKGVEVHLRELRIGDFDTRTVTDSFYFTGMDVTVSKEVQAKLKPGRINGVLGHLILKFNSAVIDYSTRTLYLRTPLLGLWPEIEGRWVATSGQEDGRERKIDPDNPLRLEFKDRRFHLTDKVVDIHYGMHIQPGKDFYAAFFFDPEEELAKELNYKAGTLLKVKDAKLTLCLCLSPAVAKGVFPSDFKAPAGSGHIVLEFRREK